MAQASFTLTKRVCPIPPGRELARTAGVLAAITRRAQSLLHPLGAAEINAAAGKPFSVQGAQHALRPERKRQMRRTSTPSWSAETEQQSPGLAATAAEDPDHADDDQHGSCEEAPEHRVPLKRGEALRDARGDC